MKPPRAPDEEDPATAVVEVHASKPRAMGWALAAMVLASPGAALVGLGMTMAVPSNLILAAVGLLPLLVFAYPAFVQLREVFSRSPRLVLDEEGLRDRALGLGTIPWEDIERVDRGPIPQHLFLMLRDPEGWLERLPLGYRIWVRSNRLFGYPPFLLNLIGTDADPDALVEAVEERVARRRALPGGRPSALEEKKPGDTGGAEEPATTDDWMGE